MKIQIEIGNRLREIREKYLIGIKLTIPQFAELVGELKHNITAYESGRANIPNRLLVTLYHKGINPVYVLTSEGNVYANNSAGRSLEQNRKEQKTIPHKSVQQTDASADLDSKDNQFKSNSQPASFVKGNIISIVPLDSSVFTEEELKQKADLFTAAAGDIKKFLKEKKKHKVKGQ